MIEQPLVSVCVPVRNGGALLQHALDSICNQTYENIEVLISDNCSTDDTASICQQLLDSDRRAKYFRQQIPLTAAENFAYLLEKAKGEYVVFCAHDDLRNNEYIEVLLRTIERNTNTILAFGEVFWFSDKLDTARKEHFDFETAHLGTYRRLVKTAFRRCYHVYGLWKTTEIRKIPLRSTLYGPDMQMMLAASCLGGFAKSSEAHFYYRESVKTFEERAQYELNQAKVARLYVLTGIWTSFLAIKEVGGFVPAVIGCGSFVARELWVRMWVRSGLRIQRVIAIFNQIISGNVAAKS